jgi:hypothetical protein
VVLDRAVLRDTDEILRRELQHESHDANVCAGVFHRLHRFWRLQRLELVDLQPLLRSRYSQRVGASALFLGGAKDRSDLVAAREECFQHGLAEVLLADDRDLHAAFFGGDENAPACFIELILPSS